MAKDKKQFQDELSNQITEGLSPDAVKAELASLVNQPGWKRIRKVFEQKEADLAKEILDTDVQEETLNRLRDRRDLVLYFINLPEILIKYLEQPLLPTDIDLDPYSKIDKQENESV